MRFFYGFSALIFLLLTLTFFYFGLFFIVNEENYFLFIYCLVYGFMCLFLVIFFVKIVVDW